MNRKTVWMVIVAGSLALAGCDWVDPSEWGDSQRYKQPFTTSAKLASGGRLIVEGFNGSIEIVGWDREEVSVDATKYASREDVMKAIQVEVASDPGMVRIRARRPLERNCNCGVSFKLRAPRKVAVEDAVTSNGSVGLESVEGSARLTTSNGAIRIWDVAGSLTARTSNGSVELDKYRGEAQLKTSNGRIKAAGVRGSVNAETSNGSVDIDVLETGPGQPIMARSSNGSITLSLGKWANNEVHAVTSNSSINLRLPPETQAELKAVTSNGHITTDYEITTREMSKTRLAGRLGGGGALIDLATSNGSIRLMRR